MTQNIFTRPLGEIIRQQPLVANYKKMWPFIKPYWFRASLGLVLALPVGALDATVALFLKYYTDDVLVKRRLFCCLDTGAYYCLCAGAKHSYLCG